MAFLDIITTVINFQLLDGILNMEKLLSTYFAIALLSVTPGILFAQDNIQLSDDYFEINSTQDTNPSSQPSPNVNTSDDKVLLTIEPSPNWNLQRDRENELIEEASFNENAFDGIITQKGVELAKNTPDIMRSGSQNTLNRDATSKSLSPPSVNTNEVPRKENVLPKTLKVRPESQPEDQESVVGSSLGDWVFDFPK